MKDVSRDGRPVPTPPEDRLLDSIGVGVYGVDLAGVTTFMNPCGAEFHLLDTGHFVLEEDLDFVAATIRNFLARELGS